MSFFDECSSLKKKTPPALKLARGLSILLDSAIRIPFTRKTIGLDGVLGAFPIVGDALTLLVSLYLIGLAYYYQVPQSIRLKMCLNVLLDFVVGSVPILGDVFDILFKANVRNYTLLFEYLEEHRPDLFTEGKSVYHRSNPSDVVVDV
jgi:hypothetical protein